MVHGDIKPQNILLGSQYATKLADFGLARFIDHGIEQKTTQIVVGTRGYLDPNLAEKGKRSSKSDVYSFGIVLLEIVSGQDPTLANHQVLVSPLLINVHSANNSGKILEAADSKLRAESAASGDDHADMERVLLVGLWCAHLDPSQRPDIAEALNALQSRDVDIPRLPLNFKAVQSVHDPDDGVIFS